MAATKRHRVFLAREGLAAVEWEVEITKARAGDDDDDRVGGFVYLVKGGDTIYLDCDNGLASARLLHKELGDFIKTFEGALGAARNDNKTATELTKRKGGRKNAAV